MELVACRSVVFSFFLSFYRVLLVTLLHEQRGRNMNVKDSLAPCDLGIAVVGSWDIFHFAGGPSAPTH